jgi:hypothetical protein
MASSIKRSKKTAIKGEIQGVAYAHKPWSGDGLGFASALGASNL